MRRVSGGDRVRPVSGGGRVRPVPGGGRVRLVPGGGRVRPVPGGGLRVRRCLLLIGRPIPDGLHVGLHQTENIH